jgi:uncharacterized delta-60 repeat protein
MRVMTKINSVRLQCQSGFGSGLAAVLFSACMVTPNLAHTAAPGDLDPSFGEKGKITVDFSGISGFDIATAVALQEDGKIIVVGYSFGPRGGNDFALVRHNTNGSLDTTFNQVGKTLTDFNNGSFDQASAVTIQGNGKIVVVGVSIRPGGDKDFAVARYNMNGSLDTAFSDDGKVLTDFCGDDEAAAVVIQDDGKIVVAGFTDVSGFNDFALVRYKANGQLDRTFGTQGKVRTDFGGADSISALALQSDGKLLAAGASSASHASFDFALARYKSNGALDTTFGDHGTARLSRISRTRA